MSCLTGAGGERQYFVGAGLGSATTIVVGNYLGEGRAASARTVSQVAFCAGLVLMAVMVGAAYALREPGFALEVATSLVAEGAGRGLFIRLLPGVEQATPLFTRLLVICSL